LNQFKAEIKVRHALSGSSSTEAHAFYDGLDLEDANIRFWAEGIGDIVKLNFQNGGILYMDFPGGMLGDVAGNIIEDAFSIPAYFVGINKPVLNQDSVSSDDPYELDSFVEWRFTDVAVRRLAHSDYELVQNISISIGGAAPFSPIYAFLKGSTKPSGDILLNSSTLRVYLPPVFSGQNIEITLKKGQIAPVFKYSSLLIDSSDFGSNEELTQTYTVKEHGDRQVRILAGFVLGDIGFDFLVDGLSPDLGSASIGFFFDHSIGTIAAFNHPMGLDIDTEGNVYVADMSNHRIRKIDSQASVTTVLGSPTGSSRLPGRGYRDGKASSALLSFPSDLDVGDDGHIYIVDSYNDRVRKLTQGIASTIVEIENIAGVSTSFGSTLSILKRTAIGVDSQGNGLLAYSRKIDSDEAKFISFSDSGASLIVNPTEISDIERVNGRMFAIQTFTGNIVEITVANNTYTQTVLVDTNLAQDNHITALAVADDSDNGTITFYVANYGTTTNQIDSDFRINRFVYDTVNKTATETEILTSFETTAPLLTKSQIVSFYTQGAYFMDDLHYLPVETYTESIRDCYGLALDNDGHLLVSDAANGLILKVFNPHM
ncbi:MAG: hypothetical protein LC539_20330, partial [Candidatus Thiodiazotropha sp.]|nr:hypothetical protein [Candidatus Thiodiazotropha sp.]